MSVPGRPLTLQDLFSQLANNASESIPLSTSEVLNQLLSDSETLLFNVSGSPPTFTTSTNYPVLVLGDYPTSYWRLAEAAAIGTAYDSNPNAYSIYPRIASTAMANVTQGAASFYTNGAAASFTGTAGRITFPNNASLQITGDLSIEFWINFSSFNTASGTYSLVTKGVTAGGGVGEFELYEFNNAGSGQLVFNQNNGYSIAAVGSLSLSTWYHIVIVRDGTAKNVKFYINGTLTATQTYTTPPSTTTGTVLLGAAGTFQAPTFLMTEVAIYHKALTSTQVTNHRSWGIASDVTATPYGGASATYGGFPYPALGPPTSASYGSGTTWGTFVWQ
jgi:hypothetical protein